MLVYALFLFNGKGMRQLFLILLSFSFISLSSASKGIEPIDKKATTETRALLYNLKKLTSEKKTIFGQHDAILYGRSWQGDIDRSDVKDVTGDHPAMIGLDYMSVTDPNKDKREAESKKLIKAVTETYRKGGVVAFAWHMSNPANDGSFYWEKDPIKVVPDLLPNGKYHQKYKEYLQVAADVTKQFIGDDGELIPVIFRPFHEFDGDWFWWGAGHCSKDEFISLWHFTVEYLRDTLEVHNFLYAFSPDCKFTTREGFLDYYPGDEYVDILGMDDYWDFRPDGGNDPALAEAKLKIIADIAFEKNKVAALTETGLEGVTDSTWFSQVLLPILRRVPIAYAMVWRNASDMEHHYYSPTKGHPAEEDFIEFCAQDDILLQSDLPDMYKFE